MTDPMRDLLSRAVDAGTPPAGYWTDYSARLRARLDETPSRRSSMLWPWLVAATASGIAMVVLIQDRPEQPAPQLTPVVAPTATVADLVPAAPVAQAPAPQSVPKAVAVSGENLPLKTIPIDPQLVAPHESARVQPVVEVARADSEPVALKLTDYRLLRNGVEIARGPIVAAEPGGVIWFVTRAGERFAISTKAHRGFEQAGVARGNLLSFDWKSDQYHWISESAIVEDDVPLWVGRDIVADDEDRSLRGLLRMPPLPRAGPRAHLPPYGRRETGGGRREPIRMNESPGSVRVGSSASPGEMRSKP